MFWKSKKPRADKRNNRQLFERFRSHVSDEIDMALEKRVIGNWVLASDGTAGTA